MTGAAEGSGSVTGFPAMESIVNAVSARLVHLRGVDRLLAGSRPSGPVGRERRRSVGVHSRFRPYQGAAGAQAAGGGRPGGAGLRAHRRGRSRPVGHRPSAAGGHHRNATRSVAQPSQGPAHVTQASLGLPVTTLTMPLTAKACVALMMMGMMASARPATTPVTRPDLFNVVRSDRSLGYNRPQRMGRRLWLPMFAMAPWAGPSGSSRPSSRPVPLGPPTTTYRH